MAQFVLVNVVVAVLMKHLEESHKQVSHAVSRQPPPPFTSPRRGVTSSFQAMTSPVRHESGLQVQAERGTRVPVIPVIPLVTHNNHKLHNRRVSVSVEQKPFGRFRYRTRSFEIEIPIDPLHFRNRPRSPPSHLCSSNGAPTTLVLTSIFLSRKHSNQEWPEGSFVKGFSCL
jgi:hypothetical protein